MKLYKAKHLPSAKKLTKAIVDDLAHYCIIDSKQKKETAKVIKPTILRVLIDEEQDAAYLEMVTKVTEQCQELTEGKK